MVLNRKPKTAGLSAILVAVRGDGSDDDAVKLACELLSPQKSTLYIVYVIEVERGLPVEAEIPAAAAKGEEVLQRMERLARSNRSASQAGLLQSRRAGPAVVQEAVDKQVDAIVLGIPYTEEYGSFSLGETAPYVLKNAPCRVVLWRDPILQPPSTNGYRPLRAER